MNAYRTEIMYNCVTGDIIGIVSGVIPERNAISLLEKGKTLISNNDPSCQILVIEDEETLKKIHVLKPLKSAKLQYIHVDPKTMEVQVDDVAVTPAKDIK